MTSLKGVFLDLSTIDRGDLDLSTLMSLDVQWTLYKATRPTETASRIEQMNLVVSNKIILNRRLLSGATSLQLICIAATGTNNVNLQAARDFDIPVTNVRRYATPSVIQHVFSLILALTTHLREYQHLIKMNRWQSSEQFCLLDYPISELHGKTMGIVGFGELGQGVARVAESLGINVLVSRRPGSPRRRGRTPFDELLGRSDILSLHCPLTDNTRKLIGDHELTLMKPSALLINTARGGIVDETALAEALKRGEIAGAGIDVLTDEPPSQGSPLLESNIPNLIVTPHIAWASQESRQRLIEEVARNIQAFIDGQTRNWVT